MSTTLVLEHTACQKIAQHLAQWLADTYVLYLKTQNFHWNVVDPRFHSLHEMFEEQYKDLAEAVDEIAERIRILRIRTPASMKEFLEITTLQENEGPLSANDMIQQLLHDHETIANYLRPKISVIQKLGDEGSADLLIERLRVHEKTAWMLRSHFTQAAGSH